MVRGTIVWMIVLALAACGDNRLRPDAAPRPDGSVEIGGQIAVHAAPVYTPDGSAAITCTVQ
jgi:hypothetical protein